MHRLGALAVEKSSRGAGFAAFLFAHRDIEGIVDMRQRAIPGPQLEIAVHGALGREILRQVPPRATRKQVMAVSP